MFKKAFQIVTTFGVLLAGYAGYVQIFAFIAAGVGQASPGRIWSQTPSRTDREATKLAQEAFGRGHWSTHRELPVRYYNHERGYWMYAKTYKRLAGGKQLRFRPFAIIWKAHDGKGLKTATSEEAIVDLDQPLGLVNKSGTSMKVLHARIEGDVRLRDDKGTPDQTIDDLVIGPMPYVEYDEPTLQIKSESDVVIQDRDMRITGYDLLIQLRPREQGTTPAGSAGSFDAKSAFLKKKVHIVLNDVGRSGILPGAAKAEQAQGSRTPLDVRCAGPMQIDLPKPKNRVVVGPPAPALPTLVFFSRDVVVVRGREGQLPDQLDCDELRLKLIPDPKPAAAKPDGSNGPGKTEDLGAATATATAAATDGPAPASATGAGTEMTLREAHATGHAVWLQSKGQGVTARCNELIHKKLGPEQPDETYLRGDGTMKLWVEKIETVAEGPDKGKVQSVTTIRTLDATIFEDGQGNQNATIVARGPGIMETRPARDKPVERKALWQDHLVMQPELGPGKQPLKQIVLTGRPELIDPAQATLDARDRIKITLRPKPNPGTASPGGEGPSPAPGAAGTGAYQIERLEAQADVHMNAPGKVMIARDWLDVVFTAPPPTTAAQGVPAAAAPAAGAPQAGTATPDPAGKTPAPAPEAEPAEPGMTITADRVWASIQMKPDARPDQPRSVAAAPGAGKTEIQEVRLRGAVAVHQDPASGKTQGTDVTGEAVDLNNQGNGKMRFQVLDQDPARLRQAASPTPKALARVVTEEMTITGPRIGLDQSLDYAWVLGAGTLTVLTNRGLLTDKGLGEEPVAAARTVEKARSRPDDETAKKQPLTISWSGDQSQMRFLGSAENPRGGPRVAKAEFYQNVRAVMTDAQLACRDRMDTYMDRPVVLARPKRVAGEREPAEPKPQIAWIDCLGKVKIVSRKADPGSRVLLQKQQIEGEYVTYDKSTGNFQVLGQGLVHLWNREGEAAGAPESAAPSTARRVTPTSNPPSPAPGPRRPGNPMTARRGSQPPRTQGAAAAAAAAVGKARAKAKAKLSLPPLKLTVVSFEQRMVGRYMAGKDADTTEPRWANFLGDVQALNAQVDNENTTFDFDRPPDDFMFLTSQKLEVRSHPTPGENIAARNYLKAIENCQAKTRNETIAADIIDYDTQKGLFYAYAEEGHAVRIARQTSTGQPVSGGQSQAVKYNRNTGESELIRPLSAIEFVDAKGIRPGPPQEEKMKPLKPDRIGAKMTVPGRSTTERKGMNGK